MSRRAELGLFVAALVCGLAAPAHALPAHHGVDIVHTYIYKDSLSPFGPAIDPEPADDELTFVDPDDGTVDVDLPFSFDYHDVARTELTVGVNGIVAFAGGADLPGADVNMAVAPVESAAPWWDDWELGPTGSVSTNTFGPAVDQTFVVRWRVRPVGGGDDDDVDFELLLREREDLIEFQYVDTTAGGDGLTGSIGISDFGYSFHEAVLDDAGFAIRWTPVFCHGHRATRLGTFGNDLALRGTPGRDVIVALSGNDRIWTKGGDDVVCGSRGEDRIDGGIGDDELWGEFAPDILLGGNGRDRLNGGGGRDTCLGGRAADVLTGCP